jgi:hypothetical protein
VEATEPRHDEPDLWPAYLHFLREQVIGGVLALDEEQRRTTQVLAEHAPDEVAAEGERFEGEPATLEWICFHVLKEYARHAGHLDISVELGAR